MEMTRKEELVLWVLQMVRGVDGQQRQWWWKSLFSFSLIQTFEEVFSDFNQWNQKRIENDEVWALWDVIWLRNEEDMRI
ncbi:hypothetical protein HKD37_03G006709 [Glycine soja]